MKKTKTNMLSIIGFITSFFSVVIASIICFIALGQIKETKEKGRSLAIAGIIINLIKILAIVILFILLIASPGKDTTLYKCEQSKNCELNSDNLTYTCIYEEDGVEEYITCKKPEQKLIDNYGTEDNQDTFDYDKE